jgi:hypothetical protein
LSGALGGGLLMPRIRLGEISRDLVFLPYWSFPNFESSARANVRAGAGGGGANAGAGLEKVLFEVAKGDDGVEERTVGGGREAADGFWVVRCGRFREEVPRGAGVEAVGGGQGDKGDELFVDAPDRFEAGDGFLPDVAALGVANIAFDEGGANFGGEDIGGEFPAPGGNSVGDTEEFPVKGCRWGVVVDDFAVATAVRENLRAGHTETIGME